MKKIFLLLTTAATLATVSCKKSTDTVVPALNDAITGGNIVMVDSTIQLSDSTAGGSWSSSDTTIATVSATGLVTGIKSGAAVISYNINQAGYPISVNDSIVVNPTTHIFPIAGGSSVSSGSSVQLTENFQGGTWSSSDTTIATITPSGLVTGIAPGTVTITYNINNLYANFTTNEAFTVQ